jgi:protein gp37
MSDLGHERISRDVREIVCNAMRKAPQHTYMILTKRPGPWMLQFVEIGAWIGVTAENQAAADERIPFLLRVPAPVRFVSVEPMLEPVDLNERECLIDKRRFKLTIGRYLDWVICGPETGIGARPCNPAWINDLAAQCAAAGVPFWDKRHVWPLRREVPKRNAEFPKGTPGSLGADCGRGA